MVCLVDLLADAHRLGLTLRLDGDRLIVRGPKQAEATARVLLARKAEVVEMLRQRASTVYVYAAKPDENAKPVDVDSVDNGERDFAEVVVEDIEPGVDPWADADPWTDATPCCSTCGSCACWVDLLDGWHCLRCSPPRIGRRIERIKLAARRLKPSTTTGENAPMGRGSNKLPL